jgi:hypothetical protein
MTFLTWAYSIHDVIEGFGPIADMDSIAEKRHMLVTDIKSTKEIVVNVMERVEEFTAEKISRKLITSIQKATSNQSTE